MPAENATSVLPSSAALAVGRCAEELLYDASWVNRRKESAHLLSAEWVRRQTSLDFTLPPGLQPIGTNPHGDDLYCVPVMLLTKVPPTLMRFDCQDETGATVALPTRSRNALATYAALCHRARVVAAKHFDVSALLLPRELRRHLLFVAFAEPERASRIALSLQGGRLGRLAKRGSPAPKVEDAEEKLENWARELRWRDPRNDDPVKRPRELKASEGPVGASSDSAPAGAEADVQATHVEADLDLLVTKLSSDDRFLWLVALAAEHSIVLAHFAAPATAEKVLRLSYDHRVFENQEARTAKVTVMFGVRPLTILFKIPYAAAQSFHFEFEPPDGFEVLASLLLVGDDLKAVEAADDEHYQKHTDQFARLEARQAEFQDIEPRSGGRVHLYKSPATTLDTVGVALRLRAERNGFVANAFGISLALSVLMTFFTAAAGPLISNTTSAPSFALLFPSIVAAVVSRGGGHAFVARMLRSARRLLLANVVMTVVMAALVLVTHVDKGDAAPLYIYLVWGALAAVSWVVTGVLYAAFRLPRPGADEGWLERRVDDVVATMRWLRRRRELRRTRAFRLVVRSNALTWKKARGIVAACRATEQLRVRIRPRWKLWPGRRVRSLAIRPVHEKPRRPILVFGANPEDKSLRLSEPARPKLVATLQEIEHRLKADYSLNIDWGKTPTNDRPIGAEKLRECVLDSALRHTTRYVVTVPGSGASGRSEGAAEDDPEDGEDGQELSPRRGA